MSIVFNGKSHAHATENRFVGSTSLILPLERDPGASRVLIGLFDLLQFTTFVRAGGLSSRRLRFFPKRTEVSRFTCPLDGMVAAKKLSDGLIQVSTKQFAGSFERVFELVKNLVHSASHLLDFAFDLNNSLFDLE